MRSLWESCWHVGNLETGKNEDDDDEDQDDG